MLFLLAVLAFPGRAATPDSLGRVGAADAVSDTATAVLADEDAERVLWQRPDTVRRRSLLGRIGRGVVRFIQGFNDVDTSYIEPQRYKYSAMVQNTNTYEIYQLRTSEGCRVTLSPDVNYRVGPYFGYRWVFLGYTFDVSHLSRGLSDGNRLMYDLSIYTQQLGLDLYYRQTGNDCHITSMDLGKGIDTKRMRGRAYDGLTSSIRGFNLYYILNHRKFSYPAAFSQSTIQRRSCGSPLVGIAYTNHKLSVDCQQLENLIIERLGQISVPLDTTLRFGTVSYTDISLSGGYAYNWVFARNWLLAGSLSLALSYKHNRGAMERKHFSLRDFTFSKITLDGIGRFGLVYNNMRWYAGASAILHAYNYRSEHFSTNNVFGSVNLYVGFNFGRRKR